MTKLKILLIEDCDNDAALAMNMLKQFDVTHAKTLLAGKAAMSTGKWDIVLLDLNMINGRKDTILGEVNAVRGNAATVILTGDSNPATRDAMIAIGADGFMVKKVDDKQKTDINYVLYSAIERRKGKV
jgi:DNA-binding NarL/FixJ family response regulator